MRTNLRIALLTAALTAAAACGLARAEPLIKEGDVVGIIGDSITEQKLYSVYIEDYLLACQPTNVRAINFGWSGEQVIGLNSRINDVLAFKPTLVTTCYGMNDGHYTTINDEIRKTYREATQKMVKTLSDSGARIVLGSPGAVDTFSYKGRATSPDVYNTNLAALGDEDKRIAANNGLTFADVHSPMIDVMAAAKAKYGAQFQIAGGDGVHPGPDGHLVMAYAFLKALGFEGNVGEFDVDLAAHTAVATGGHKVVKVEGNAITIESARYPFCYTGKFGDAGSTIAATEFIPFSQDLNRLTLKATGPAASYKVTWGNGSKTYTADQLKAGINLAADFQDNPFSAPFAALHQQVSAKQAAETALIKNLLHALGSATPFLPDQRDAVTNLAEAIKLRDQALAAELRNAVKPVTHTITIEAAQLLCYQGSLAMPLTYQTTTLPNGLTIAAEHNGDAHSFSAGFFVKTGSRDETAEINGVSHFLEHMMFKGSATTSWEDVNRVFDEIGARYNAFTSQEMTAYFANVIPEFTERALSHLALLLRPAIRQEDFDTEKNVILEEIAMYLDDPGHVLYEDLMHRHFGSHPMGMSILGSADAIKRLKRDEMAEYFERRYGPGNTVLAITGQFDFDHVVAMAEKYCGHWMPMKAPRETTLPVIQSSRHELTDRKLNRNYTMALMPGPSAQDDRRFAARVLADVLGDSDGSRYYWALVDNAIAEEADFGFYPHDGCGSFYISLVTDPDKSEKALDIALAELKRLKSDLKEDEVKRAVNKIASSLVLGGESPMGRMRALGNQWAYTGQYRSLDDDMRTLLAVTPDSLRNLLDAFPPDPMTVVTLGPGK